MASESERELVVAIDVSSGDPTLPVPSGHILLVDDEPDLRESVATALELDGHRVSTAVDGLDAFGKLAQTRFEAIVLDVLMPNLNGFEVCRRLRAAGNRTPILILTARDSEEDTIRGLDLGADDYLVKPFALGELLARVRALLRTTATWLLRRLARSSSRTGA